MARKYEDRLTPSAWVDMCDIAMIDIKKQMVDLRLAKPFLDKEEYKKRRIRLSAAMVCYRKKKKMMQIKKNKTQHN